MNDREKDTKRFYELLKELEERVDGKRRLKDCDGRMGWPRRGVYFFFEEGEYRSGSVTDLRVVRVGTHALRRKAKTRIWRRLYEHRYHNGASVFRGLVRTALTRRGDFCSGESRKQKDMKVTDYIGNMPFLWVNISDEPGPDSQRALVERESIALLSDHDGFALDKQSVDWLGQFSNRAKVQSSGLWNSNHVDQKYNPSMLDTLEKWIEETKPLNS